MKIRTTAVLAVAFATAFASSILPAKADGGASSNADVGVGVTTNTTNQLIAPGGGRGKGPVAPAVAPAMGDGSIGNPGEARVRLSTQQLCRVYDSQGNQQVHILNTALEVALPSKVSNRGASGAISFAQIGLGGAVKKSDITPSNPIPQFQQLLLENEASQIASCEAAENPQLRRDRVEGALRTLKVLRRGRLEGMPASEEAIHLQKQKPAPAPSRAAQPAPAVRALW